MAVLYRHTQVGYAMVVALGLPLAVLAVVLVRHFEWAPGLAAAVLFGALVTSPTLTTIVREQEFECFFGLGLFRRRIPIAEIVEVRVVENRWFYGWGMRITPQGWLWNVSGFEAVEIALRDGRRFRVGSDEPAALAEALRQAVVAHGG